MKSEAYLLAICRNYVNSSIPEGVTPALAEAEDDRAQKLLDEGVQWLRERGVAARGSLEYGRPVECISTMANEIGADLIVVGHKRRSRLARWWREADEETLLERVSCSILAAAGPPDE